MYKIKSITAKYQKSDGKLMGYNVLVENEKGTYNFSDFYSVEDMKKTFGVDTVENSRLLVGKQVVLNTSIELVK